MNHLDLVGWINTFRYKWAELTGREIKFKPATFYLGVTDHLAKAVEGQSQDDLENQEFTNDLNQNFLIEHEHHEDNSGSSTRVSPIEELFTPEPSDNKGENLFAADSTVEGDRQEQFNAKKCSEDNDRTDGR